MEEQIKTALADGPKTVAELATALEKGETTVRKTVKALADAGALVKEGTKYKLAETPPAEGDESRGRGRPKDPFVKVRDDRVLELIEKSGEVGVTTATIAEQLEITTSQAYISVWRLKNAGKIAKVLNGTRQPAYSKAAA